MKIWLNRHAYANEYIYISKSFTFLQNIECEKLLFSSSSEEIFNPPQKKSTIFSTPIRQVFEIFLHPHLSTSPHCWFKNDQPLTCCKHQYVHLVLVFVFICPLIFKLSPEKLLGFQTEYLIVESWS